MIFYWSNCCFRFHLPKPIYHYRKKSLNVKDPDVKEYKIVYNILVPLYRYTHPEFGLGYYYRCKKLDLNSGKCTMYKQRPEMCKGYPYKGDCEFINCESKHCKNFKKLS